MYGLKLFFRLLPVACVPYRCVHDDWQLCLFRVNSFITHLQLKKMSVIYQSVHVAITFQLLEMSSITTPNQTISNIRTRNKFSRKNISGFTNLHNEKNQIWKLHVNRIGYWNSCKRLPNFVNVAALLECYFFYYTYAYTA